MTFLLNKTAASDWSSRSHTHAHRRKWHTKKEKDSDFYNSLHHIQFGPRQLFLILFKKRAKICSTRIFPGGGTIYTSMLNSGKRIKIVGNHEWMLLIQPPQIGKKLDFFANRLRRVFRHFSAIPSNGFTSLRGCWICWKKRHCNSEEFRWEFHCDAGVNIHWTRENTS